jgi:hypothetical protein
MNEEKPMEIHHDLTATFKSNMAPLWLVFNNSIFNTHNITNIDRMPNGVFIYTIDGKVHSVEVPDATKVWESLQTVFSEGATA